MIWAYSEFFGAKKGITNLSFFMKILFSTGATGIDFVREFDAIFPEKDLLTIRLFLGPKTTI